MDYQQKKASVLHYLSTRYHKPFEIVGYIGQTWGLSADRFDVRQTESGDAFTVFGEESPDGYQMTDSYHDMLVLPAIQTMADAAAANFFTTYTLDVSVGHMIVHIDAIGDHDDFQKQAEAFVTVMAQQASGFWIECVYGDLSTSDPFASPPTGQTATYYIDEAHTINPIDRVPPMAHDGDVVPLNEWQIERLCCFVYLDGILHASPKETVGDLVLYMHTVGLGNQLPCEMTREDWNKVLQDILDDAALSDLHIVLYEDVTQFQPDVLPGQRAVCFMDTARNAYVVFRGTCGDEEWLDNADGLVQSDTVQQKAALRFVVKVKEQLSPNTLTVAGHSKGGNKAQYVSIVCPDHYVNACVSIDGQGFSLPFFKKYAPNIKTRKGLHLLAEQRDFVNGLGVYLSDTAFYRGWRGEPQNGRPYGDPLSYFHCPDALRTAQGQIGNKHQSSIIATVIHCIVTSFLSDDQYKDQRDKTARAIISLMMRKRKSSNEQIAKAIANISLLFFDLTAKDKAFDQHINDLLYEEPDVLVATIEAAFGGQDEASNEKSLRTLACEEIVRGILSKPSNLLNFARALLQLTAISNHLFHSAVHSPDVLLYLLKAICSILKKMLDKVPHLPPLKKLLDHFQAMHLTALEASTPSRATPDRGVQNDCMREAVEHTTATLNQWVTALEEEAKLRV